MPYTPPSQQSPASSKPASPALSRNSSYLSNSQGLGHAQQNSHRPNLPRSVSSTSYLNKHRRSPSMTQSVGFVDQLSINTRTNSSDEHKAASTLATNGSIRQSPPPLNNLLIPTGAIISPPDSSENSDGDETDKPHRGHGQQEPDGSWGELQQAVRSMNFKRESSPERQEQRTAPTPQTEEKPTSEPTTTIVSPNTLSPEARKISHSRSSTETAIAIPNRSTFTESPVHSSDDNSDEDDERPQGKPPLLRKKSGELVKPALRPSSRRRYSSMPGTPTYNKSVHFNDNGNQTRHFLQVDKPMAVSAGSSPVETYESESEYPFENTAANTKIEWELKLANFPVDMSERKLKPIYVERLFMSGDGKSLVGNVAVANISFHKTVVARFTLDYWKTTSEVTAEFNNDVRQKHADGYDRFNFTIRLSDQANLENKTLLLCMRYNVIGQEHWDNNENQNYQIDFVKKVSKASQHMPQSTLGARPLSAIPRSRHSPPATARGRTPSIDDDIVSRFDGGPTYHFGPPESLLGDAPSSIKLKPRAKRPGAPFPGASQPSNGLGGRYDFGASLSAALSTAQDKLGRNSGLMSGSMQHQPEKGYFAPESSKDVKPEPESARPEALATDRPAMGSAQYKDLVSKFCYFTPSSTTSGKTSPLATNKQQPQHHDGASDYIHSARSVQSSGTVTPSPPTERVSQLDGTDESGPRSIPLISRSASPAPMNTGRVSRSGSPASYRYPYGRSRRDGYLSDSPTPTAIRG